MRRLDEELHDAVLAGDELAVSVLLDRGARASASDGEGLTALHYAASDRRVGIASLLLGRGSAEVNAADRQGRTPLHLAVAVAKLPRGPEMVCLLIARGADARRRDMHGESPLDSARRQERQTGGAISYLFDVN